MMGFSSRAVLYQELRLSRDLLGLSFQAKETVRTMNRSDFQDMRRRLAAKVSLVAAVPVV